MKKVFLTLCMALALFANGANAVEKEKVERPKQVAGIVVDQMLNGCIGQPITEK